MVEELLLLDQGLLDEGRDPLLPVAPELGANAHTLTVGQAPVSNHLEGIVNRWIWIEWNLKPVLALKAF